MLATAAFGTKAAMVAHAAAHAKGSAWSLSAIASGLWNFFSKANTVATEIGDGIDAANKIVSTIQGVYNEGPTILAEGEQLATDAGAVYADVQGSNISQAYTDAQHVAVDVSNIKKEAEKINNAGQNVVKDAKEIGADAEKIETTITNSDATEESTDGFVIMPLEGEAPTQKATTPPVKTEAKKDKGKTKSQQSPYVAMNMYSPKNSRPLSEDKTIVPTLSPTSSMTF